ncbi:unnamed protein product [Tilletia laevis]|uniref:Carboxypeptidase n=2 Tax=Tilletia TaxID=13289 RepID=A0A8X7SYI5_9BASI|nr:hypothetical protein CF336_g912 [Tilletia laevis]KAE8249817.1 hypothetical protein A4X06_0g3051 [Tilletia controversa]KAE8206600.1 hypothetical protein CF335_g1760 [Tilletia laevis]CAD6897744.1 unnamed protein product [Tilletia laevis]CAD6908693.1 unnamed protein product [Tilletia controversa]
MLHPRLLLAAVGLVSLLGQAYARPPPTTVSNPKAKFLVNRNVPGIPFALNDSYAGYLPVSEKPKDKDREIFFWAFPADKPTKNTVLWLQGGPGCSGMEGLFSENGPFILAYNSTKAVKNPYSWTQAANMIYVDQPIGTGLSKGETKIHNENGVAHELLGFLENFFDVFDEFKGDLWLAGESYAGMYTMYLADAIYSRPAAVNAKAGINLKGITTIDAVLSSYYVSAEIPSVPYAIAHQHDLKLSDKFIEKVVANVSANGLLGYLDKYLKYPPTGPIPMPQVFSKNPKYSPWNMIADEATRQIGDSFNIYNTDPKYSWYNYKDPLGAHGQDFSANNFINNQTGFKEAIHADPNIIWRVCSERKVFVKDWDKSPFPDETVLNRVIDLNTRTVIQHGMQDFILIANGTRLMIQNATFGGLQGFQEQPHRQFIVDGKSQGTFHSERKVTLIEFNDAGHMIPTFVPDGALKALRYLIGEIGLDDLGK